MLILSDINGDVIASQDVTAVSFAEKTAAIVGFARQYPKATRATLGGVQYRISNGRCAEIVK